MNLKNFFAIFITFLVSSLEAEVPNYSVRVETSLVSTIMAWYHHETDENTKNLVVEHLSKTLFIYFLNYDSDNPNRNSDLEKIATAFISGLSGSEREVFRDPFLWNNDDGVRWVSPIEMTDSEYRNRVTAFLDFFDIE